MIGLLHEAVFYDDEVFVQPVRDIRFFSRQGEFNDVSPNNLTFCRQTIFPSAGRPLPVSPGSVIEYEVEDLYGRPWAQSWEKHFEQHMQRPAKGDEFNFQ